MAESRTTTGRIFISYRREDSAYAAGWLFDRLDEHFAGGQIFKDVDSIELGDDFVEAISKAVGSCDVLLALIGDRWLTITDEHGRRRLDDPSDFVRVEIESALKRNVRVIPILVDGAKLPDPAELPPNLVMLVRRQALELSPNTFDFGTSQLLKVLDKTIAQVRSGADEAEDADRGKRRVAGAAPEPKPAAGPRVSSRTWILAGVGVVVALVVGIIVAAAMDSTDGSTGPPAASEERQSGQTEGGVIFEDDFSDATGGWEDGVISNGTYSLAARAGNNPSQGGHPRDAEALFPDAPSDVSIEVQAARVAAGSDDPDNGHGISCRAAPDETSDYSFILASSQVTIGKWVSEEGFTTLNTVQLRGFDPASPHTLRAECSNVEGQEAVHLEFLLDESVVAQVTDTEDPLMSGSVALFATTVDTLEVEFDNFVAREI